MCGIFGLIGKRDQEEVKAANRTIAHRGPDAEGFWFDPENSVALCHRRLSILDLSASGAQPMRSQSGRYMISYNGEIYNYLEIKEKLSSKNWQGHSDTEVLLACFEEWGIEKTLENIDGMFAIILWDKETKNITLMRDRLGEKPLYYGLIRNNLVFASELKPIISLFKNELSLCSSAIEDYFHRSCISGERSIFNQILKLPAGHFITVSTSSVEKQAELPRPIKYWALKDLALGSLNISKEEAIVALENKLKKSVRNQMISDVPLGAFLSGGVDSSLIVALMQSQSSKKVKSFSIGFENTHYNEAHHAKAVAQHLGAEHEELYVSEKDLLDQIPGLSHIYDEPFADSSQIPTILVSKMARKHVTVALSGDGGDELFAGYNRHLFAQTQWPKVSSVPSALRSVVGNSLTLLPPGTWKSIFSFVSTGTAQPHEKVFKLAEVLKSSSMSDFYKSVSSHWNDFSPLLNKNSLTSNEDWDVQSALEMCLADAKWYMPDDVLVKVDRAAMSQSLETRAPFLSRDVVEMAFALPMDLKIRDGQTKWILRQILYKHVPKELIERPKMGFGVPMDSWLRNELKDWAWSLLNPEALKSQDILDSKMILQKWDEHQRGRRNWFTELWDVLMFLSWRQQYKI
jgi:asparagine synthase (glutamine-hydrolysing)